MPSQVAASAVGIAATAVDGVSLEQPDGTDGDEEVH